MLKGFLNACRHNITNTRRINLQSIKDRYNTSRSSIIPTSRSRIIRNTSKLLIGFSAAAVGCFGATKPAAGLSFKMSPHYSPNESYLNNLKTMVVSMMMTDNLDKDEVTFLTNAVDILYSEENANCKKRKDWCLGEMKNYMICAERYSSFQHNSCKEYRKMLKNCLQAKKGALSFVQIPSSETETDKSCNKYPASRRNQHVYKVLGPSVTIPLYDTQTPNVPPVTPKACNAPPSKHLIPVEVCDPPHPAEPCIRCKVCEPARSQPTLPVDASGDSSAEPIFSTVCDLSLNEPIKMCDPPAEPVCNPATEPVCNPATEPVSQCECDPTLEVYESSCTIESSCSEVTTEMYNLKCATPERESLNCEEICNDDRTEQFGPGIDDVAECILGYEEWTRKQQCGGC